MLEAPGQKYWLSAELNYVLNLLINLVFQTVNQILFG